MLLTGRAGALLAFALGACDGPTCPTVIGNPRLPIEAVLIAEGTVDTASDVTPGATLLLEPPPQGGYVTYAGARVRNLAACNVTFEGSLRDPATRRQAGYDRRQSNLVADASGWGVPEAPLRANLPNINPCPDYSASDVHGQTLTLEVKITDQGGRSAFVSTPVVPRCQLSDPGVQYNCICTCSANYFLGKCNFGDGGTDAGAPD